MLIKNWRWEYSNLRPHSSLGYRPPVPEAWLHSQATFAPLRRLAKAAPAGEFASEELVASAGAGQLHVIRLERPGSIPGPKPVEIVSGMRDVKIVLPAR